MPQAPEYNPWEEVDHEWPSSFRAPTSQMLRRGTGVALLVFAILLVLAAIIPYHEEIKLPVVIESYEPLLPLHAPHRSMITAVYKTEGDTVARGDIILLLDEHVSLGDLHQLQNILKDTSAALLHQLPALSNIGSLEISYLQLRHAHEDLTRAVAQGKYAAQLAELQAQIAHNREATQKLVAEEQLTQKGIDIATNNIEQFKALDALEATTEIEIEQAQRELLARQSRQQQILQEMAQNNSREAQLRQQQAELMATSELDKFGYWQAYHTKLAALEQDVKRFLRSQAVVAPKAGVVRLSGPLRVGETVPEGVLPLAIAPRPMFGGSYQASGYLDNAMVGRVTIGQHARLMVDTYPFREYGAIVAHVTQVAESPDADGRYYVVFTLPDGLFSQYGNQLSFRHGLRGQVAVIVSRHSVLKRLFFRFKDKLDNKRHLD